MNTTRVCIIGNGVAGVTAAAELRRQVPDAEALRITIFTREPHNYYSRIRLPEVFDSDTDVHSITVYPAEWYTVRNIEVIRSSGVEMIDRARKELHISDGSTVPYDKLVLAAGADPFRPSIPGMTLSGVHTVRTFDDADSIRSRLRNHGGNVVVVGGGLLGLETARHLVTDENGAVTVLEIAPRLLPRQLDAAGAGILEAMLCRQGMRFITGAEIVRLHGNGCLTHIELKDGRTVAADTAVFCMGITPRVELPRAAGLTVQRGIVVNEFLQTSDPDIFAVGDNAEYNGMVWGIVPAALEQARTAASNIVRDAFAIYRPSAPKTTLKVAGVILTSIGDVTGENPSDISFLIIAADRGRYEKLVIRNGILAGAILLGGSENLAFVTERMGKALDRSILETGVKIPTEAEVLFNGKPFVKSASVIHAG